MLGSISLLLWGSFTVRSAVERSFAASLNGLLAKSSRNGFMSMVAGLVAAVSMQSATATILLSTSLLSAGTLSLAAAMAMILGADLGSAIASRILYIDLSFLPPLLLFLGLMFHLNAVTWRGRYLGRILIGLGLMLLSIIWMKQIIGPLSSSPLPADWLSVLRSVPWVALILVALITWFAHSSVAVVLVIASFAQSQLVTAELFVPMLLGANIGAGFIALFLIGKEQRSAKSVVICNLALRTGLAVVTLVAVFIAPELLLKLQLLDSQPGAQVIILHIVFNAILAIIFLPFAATLAKIIHNRLDQVAEHNDQSNTTAVGHGLDPELMSKPQEALASARREAMRLADLTESLLSRSLELFEASDQSQIVRLAKSDMEINQRNKSIHRFLSELRPSITDQKQEKKIDHILAFASTMENVGDIVSHDLVRLATKQLDRGIRLSLEGQEEIQLIHREVLSLLRTEINRFVADSPHQTKKSRKIVKQIRILCDESVSRHRRRLSDQKLTSISSSSIHQDTVRDFLQVTLLLDHNIGVAD